MWYKKLNFEENPFVLDRTENNPLLIGIDKAKDDLIYAIASGNMLFIEGAEGSGKTSLLKYPISKFGGIRKVVYVDCEKLEKELNIENVLIEKNGILGRLLKRKPKHMILLLDNIHKLSKKNCERIKHYFDQNYLKSVIFAGVNYKSAEFTDSLKDRIGDRIIRLNAMDEGAAIEMVVARLNMNREIIPVDVLKEVYRTSKKNPKEILSNCEKLCALAIEEGQEQVTKEHISKLLKKDIKEKEKKKMPKKLEEAKKKKDTINIEYSSEITIGKKEDDWKENEEELEDELGDETKKEKKDPAEEYY